MRDAEMIVERLIKRRQALRSLDRDYDEQMSARGRLMAVPFSDPLSRMITSYMDLDEALKESEIMQTQAEDDAARSEYIERLRKQEIRLDKKRPYQERMREIQDLRREGLILEKEKEKEMLKLEKENERERLKLEKELERLRLENERERLKLEKELERLRLENERERLRLENERERLRLENERERLRLEKQKERERLRLEKEKERERVKREQRLETQRLEREKKMEEERVKRAHFAQALPINVWTHFDVDIKHIDLTPWTIGQQTYQGVGPLSHWGGYVMYKQRRGLEALVAYWESWIISVDRADRMKRRYRDNPSLVENWDGWLNDQREMLRCKFTEAARLVSAWQEKRGEQP